MRLEIERGFEWVPEFNDNKADPEPIKFHCRYLTVAQRNQFYRIDAGAQKLGDYDAMVRLCVERIENLIVGGEKIATAEDLLKGPDALNPLFTELVTELISRNSMKDTSPLP